MADLTDNEVRALIAEEYDDELAACRELLEFATEEVQGWSGRPVKRGADRIIVFEAARATKTLDAVITLCALGFGEQAVMLNRSLFEGMATAHWVSENRREAVGLFSRHARFGALLWRETFEALGWMDDADRKRARSVGPKQRKEFKRLFGPYGTKPWTRRSVPKLLEQESINGTRQVVTIFGQCTRSRIGTATKCSTAHRSPPARPLRPRRKTLST